MHSLFSGKNSHFMSLFSLKVTPKLSFTNFVACSIARKVFRLQHLGPPCSAMERRVFAVERLANRHSCLERGFASVIKLTKMPVPTAAPQSP